MEPGFFLSYYRPWDKNASLVSSWGDYLRNTDIASYTAERIGEHIQEATRELGYAIQEQIAATQVQTRTIAAIGSAQLQALAFLNQRMDIVLEQQRMGMMLQQNIADLLKIPDSEKERLQAITHGMQFFTNAARDVDLFDDALDEFLKAEQMRKQDYFVLHRIGCIYLYVEKHLDPLRAVDYFSRAAKYAAAESSPDAVRLANILTNPVNDAYTEQTTDPDLIKKLAADSYEKAALASYILGDDTNAVTYQKKALSCGGQLGRKFFFLGKYLLRNGQADDAIRYLRIAITNHPEMCDAVDYDADVAKCSEAVRLATTEKNKIDNRIEEEFLATVSTMPQSEEEKIRRSIFTILHAHRHLPYALKDDYSLKPLFTRSDLENLKQIIPTATEESNLFYPEWFDDENTELFLSADGEQIYLDLRTYTSDDNSTIAGVDLIPDSTDITKKIHFTGAELWLDTQRKDSRFVCRRSLTLPPDALDAIVRDGKIQIQEGGKTKSYTINTSNFADFIWRSIGKLPTARKQSFTEDGILCWKIGSKCYNHEGEIPSKTMFGKGIEYDGNGNKVFEGEFNLGERHKGIEYDGNGKRVFEGSFLSGERRKGIEYDENGKKVFEGKFSDGKRDEGIEYDGNGNKVFEGIYSFGKGIEYDGNGKKVFEGEYLHGKRHKGIEYDGSGNRVFEGEYLLGKRSEGIEYDGSGKKVFEGTFLDGKRLMGIEYDGNDKNETEEEFKSGDIRDGIESDENSDKVFERNDSDREKSKSVEDNREKSNDVVDKKEGCYIATAVYGSYDCPEVWTLRRFRDNVLAETRAGRLFIKLYYAVSPSLVRRFGRTGWFNAFFRKRLDRFVLHLRRRGFENTMYHDKH